MERLEEEPAPTGETSAPPAPKTAKQLAARRNQERVKSILLLAIPDDNRLKYQQKVPKKTSPFIGIKIALIMRNKPDIDEIDIDDLYNNLRVYEDEMKRSLSSTSTSQNLAFLSSENTSSTNEVSTASGDFGIDEDDLEELDLRWQVAMLTVRVRKFIQKTGRNMDFKEKRPVSLDKSKIECYNYHRKGHFARECRSGRNQGRRTMKRTQLCLMAISSSSSSSSSDNEVQKCSKQCLESFKTLQKNYDSEREKHSRARLEIQGYELALESLESRILVHEKNELAWGEKYDQMSARDKTGLGYDTQLNEMSNNSETDSEISLSVFDWNFLTPRADISFVGLDEYAIRKKIIESKTTNLNTKIKIKLSLRIGTENDDDDVSKSNIRVLTRTGLITPVKQNEKRAVHKVSTTRPVSTARPVSTSRPVSTARPVSSVRSFAPKIAQTSGAIRPIYPRMDNFNTGKGQSRILLQDHAVEDSVALAIYWQQSLSIRLEDTMEALWLFGDFKLLDESQVVLRAPRKDDVYSLDLKNIIPSRGANAGESSFVYLGEKIPIDASTLPNSDLPIDPNMPDLEDDSDAFSIPIPTLRIHKNHRKAQILGDPKSAVQTRGKIQKASSAQQALVSYISKKNIINHKDHQNYLLACFLSQEEPKNISQALQDESWVEAMQEELLQFKLLKVWILVDLPSGKKAISTKFRQEEGIDYDEVFAPVARIEAIRLFLAFASYMGFIVYQMDVKSAFLYGTIKEEVYVHQPPGFVDPAHLNKFYKVIKALYGLLLEPLTWYETLSSFLMENGFRRGTIDKTLFIKKKKSDIMLVQVYVDDIIFGSTKKSMCTEFEDCMHKRFQMSSMGELTFFLGLQVKQQPDGIFISQDKYVADILKKFDFWSIRTATTPIESNKPLVKDEDGEDVDVHVYRSMIGSLMYLTASRPDIMFAITTEEGLQAISATIDGHEKLITKDSLRRHLKLYDAEGISSLSNEEIFEHLAHMGITNMKSPLLLKAMVKNLDSPHKLLLYPRFIQLHLNKQQRLLLPHTRTYPTPILTSKLFSNMRRASKGYSGVATLLFDNMLVQAQDEEQQQSPSRITSSPSLSLQPTPPSPLPEPIQPTHEAEETASMPYDSPLHAVHSHGSAEGSVQQHDLMVLVTKLNDRIDGLEKDLLQTKKTYSTALTPQEEEVHEKPSDETEVLVQEETPTEIIEEHGSGEKGEMEISTANIQVSTASPPKVSTVYPSRALQEEEEEERLNLEAARELQRQLDQRQDVPIQPTQTQGID
ncbi:putative ribonuclease H-like domain-containing protein [Tanacetum coccineum]|uniref:Ribonuclease H-like domain-containing protein n=1 Tax=Tanacetum coccineum TaxID=301880 RepID=A0ABQ5I1M9_9ASTR